MKFFAFKEFRDEGDPDQKDISKYLATELASVLRELRAGLPRLDFIDNFESFQVSLSIESGVEIAVRNELKGFMPSRRVIMRSNEAGLSVCDGDTPWDQNYLYLKNVHPTDTAEIQVIFFR